MGESNKHRGSTEQSHKNLVTEDPAHVERNSTHDVSPALERDIDDPDTRFIYIGPDTAIAVDSKTGQIRGAKAEGTLSIIIYGGEARTLKGKRFETERAIRIPRLLQSDILLNFHVAEIAYHESRQAAKFGAVNTVLGATNFYRLDVANTFTTIPGSNEPCYVGFYLSPTSQYQVCLVSEIDVWPNSFSKYLAQMGLTSEELFKNISLQCESSQEDVFSKLLFLPERMVQGDLISNKSALKTVSRETLGVDYAKREIGGWWFNIPVAVYPWMTANLERLLTGYVDGPKNDNNRNEVANLRSWNLYEWFQLVRHLALGLNALHREGAIHGDPRPANIMTYIQDRNDFGPEGFRWIDIGLGYGAGNKSRDGNEETVITPRPLGGGRTTVFYAPEREETLEFEDADVVHLEQLGNRNNRSVLTFYWREQTHLPPAVLPLKKGDRPVRELGRLNKGDRIQVREFVLEVEDVEENSIVISGIYEVFLDRVLVEKRSSSLFSAGDIKDTSALAIKLRDAQDPLSAFLQSQLTAGTRGLLEHVDFNGSGTPPESLQQALVSDLNQLLRNSVLFDEQRFGQVVLSEKTRRLIAEDPQGEGLIYLNRLLLEEAYPDEIAKSQRELVHERLNYAPISRYQIFQQWSQATDIYGLGMVTLYLFFLKGVYALKNASGLTNESSGHQSNKNSIYDRTNRERTFSEVARLLRNRSFLENLLVVLDRNGFNKLESLWHQELQTPESEVAKKVSDELHAMDANFEFIWRGLNGNNGLFIQVIYFCLCCVWRKEEVEEIVQRRKVDFEPFCESRIMIESEEKSVPSRKARIALEQLQIISATSPVKEGKFADSPDPEALGRSREEQMITLREDLQAARARIEVLEDNLSQNTKQATSLGTDLQTARTRIKKLEETLSERVGSAEMLFGSIHETLESVTQQLDKHKVILGGVDKVYIQRLINDLSRLAKEGKSLGDRNSQNI